MLAVRFAGTKKYPLPKREIKNQKGNDALRVGGECIAIDPADNSKIWAGARHGLWASSDAGETWRSVGTPSLFNTTAFGSIHLHPNPKFAGQIWIRRLRPG